jgi:aspartate racemase
MPRSTDETASFGSSGAEQRVLGILGGMGPLASAAFVQTLYEHNPAATEQDGPRCVMISDPSIPDRSAAILSGDDEAVLRRLSGALADLEALRCDRLVVPCMTAHHFFPRLPTPTRERLISLVDLTVDAIAARPGRTLILCTTGVRRARLFESHPRWTELSGRAVVLGDEEQAAFHRFLFDVVKRNQLADTTAHLGSLRARHTADALAFACTDLHLITRRWMADRADDLATVIDPLWSLARDLGRYLG